MTTHATAPSTDWQNRLRDLVRTIPPTENLTALDIVAGALGEGAPEPVTDTEGNLHCPYPDCRSDELFDLDMSVRFNTVSDWSINLGINENHDLTWLCAACGHVLTKPAHPHGEWPCD